MRKKIFTEKDFIGMTPIVKTESGIVIKLKDGSIIKIFDPNVINMLKFIKIDIEKKILDAKPIPHSLEIITPTSIVYDKNGNFTGYTMPHAKGTNYNDIDDRRTIEEREDLQGYGIIHSRIENILKRNTNIVFPDICTCDNIFIDQNGNIQLIDYDGMQINGHRSPSISTSLGNSIEIMRNPKYCDKSMLYTKELDKRSSIILYFLTAFNINLNNVGIFNPITGKNITLDDIFEAINLEDPELCHKVWKLFQDNQPNDYLGDTVFDIAEKYDLKVFNKMGDTYFKRLEKKH